MGKWKFYLLLPMFAVLAFGSVSFAQEFDKDAFKAELRAELKAELKKELLSELKEEMKAEILSETKAEVQEATLGLRDVLRTDFADEIRSEIMQEDISSAVEEALAGSAIMGGLFKGTTVGGYIEANYMYNLALHGDSVAKENPTGGTPINFLGENEDDTFVVEAFALFLDKEVTDEDPIGWQAHLYWGEKAKAITFLGDPSSNDVDRDDISTFATANISWNAPLLGKHVNLTFGKFYTWIGYELVENIGNPNYSHGFLYNNWIPFTHTGLSADVSEFLPSDKLGLTLYYINGWDSFIDNNESKSLGAYATYSPNDDFFISLGVIHGSEGWGYHIGEAVGTLGASGGGNGQSNNNNGQTTLFDVVATYSLPQVDKLSLGLNVDWGTSDDSKTHDMGGPATAFYTPVVGDGFVDSVSDSHWWGVAGFAMYDWTDNQMGAVRYEFADDTDGAKGFGYSMWSATYTHNITVRDNLMLRPEIRYNHYSEHVIATERAGNATEVAATTTGLPGEDNKSARDDETIIGLGVEYVF
jgi:hypothetical protein